MFSWANNVLATRRRIRRELTQPSDELDDAVHDHDAAFDRLLSAPHGHPTRAAREARVLFWPRTEIPRAHQQWPHLVEHTDVDAIARDREAANRELAETGVARIVMVPLTTTRLTEYATRTGGDPADENTRHGCMNEIIDDGATVNWPPGRNQPCWCGSTTKYKKCCGRPIPPDLLSPTHQT